MKIQELIAHYRAAKTAYDPISASLDDKLAHLSDVFGNMDASSTGAEIVAAAMFRWGERARGTLKRYLVQLNAVLNRAERDGLIQRAPKVDLPYVHDTVYVDMTGDQVTALLDYVQWNSNEWYQLTLVLCHTGARLSEALALTEHSFTRHGVRIAKRVGRKTKTVDRTIPYSTRLSNVVQAGAIQLVPDGIADQSVSTCLGRVLDGATEALKMPKLRVHDLRHAYAAVLAEKGADLSDISAALGHSNPVMAMRYRGLVKGRLNTLMMQV